MRNLLISLVAIILISSCKKDTTYQLQIFIKNNTVNKLKVTLYPKSKYMYGDLYDFCDFGGGYADTTLDIDLNDQKSLYISSNLDQKPYDLTSKIFDSIYVKLYDNGIGIIKFSNDTVIDYSDNLFRDNSNWIYKKNNYSEKTNFSTHPIESHDYIFEISK
jgi:hypothetical protein